MCSSDIHKGILQREKLFDWITCLTDVLFDVLTVTVVIRLEVAPRGREMIL